jgi:hypothetical protein
MRGKLHRNGEKITIEVGGEQQRARRRQDSGEFAEMGAACCAPTIF